MEITVDHTKSAVITAQLAQEQCKVLIDTGAARCCIREDYYNKLSNAPLELLKNVRIRSATGRDLQTLGRTVCPIELGGRKYNVEFIVCRNLRRPAILGLDFLRQNRIGTTWTPQGTFALQRVFEVCATPEFCNKHPSLNALPVLHKTDLETRENVPYLLINLSMEDEEIKKREEMVTMQLCPYQLQEIAKERYNKQNDKEQTTEEEINFIDEEKVFEQYNLNGEKDELEKKFITSPAQVESQRRVKLQDAYVSEKDKNNFRNLCKEYEDIFSKSSEDIGHTPLVTMDIDTGDSPPVCQRPYSLPLKHVEWVTKELEILKKAGVISRSVSPWASPIVIVPKKS